jgi:hypothetical protein
MQILSACHLATNHTNNLHVKPHMHSFVRQVTLLLFGLKHILELPLKF